MKENTQGLDDAKLTAEFIFLLVLQWSLHCNGSDTFLFINATKIYQFKAN